MSAKQQHALSFAYVIVGPVILAFLLTVATVVGFVALSVERTDQTALAQQTRLLTLALDELAHDVSHVHRDLIGRDEPTLAYAQGSTDWFMANFGRSELDYASHTRDYILTPDRSVFLAMHDRHAVGAQAFETVRAQVTTLADALFSSENRQALSSYRAGNRDDPPMETAFTVLDGQPAVISVAPLVPRRPDLRPEPGKEPIHISVVMLDATVANSISDRYILLGARFDTHSALGPDEAAVASPSDNGQPTVWLKWLPDHPGRSIGRDALPAFLSAIAMMAAITALLLFYLRRAGSQLLAERADAHHRALHDPLTGLGNRALFRNRLEQAFRSMPRTKPAVALLALDLDKFKHVNDTLGHDAGDELLRQVSARISAVLRPTDTLVRLGGDEFAIIQSGIAAASDAAALADRVLAAVRPPYAVAGSTVQIGVSIGIVTAPDNARTENELVTRSDDALYKAKAAGRNCFCFYDERDPGHGLRNDAPEPAQLSLGLA